MMFLLIHFDLVVDAQKYAQLSAYVDFYIDLRYNNLTKQSDQYSFVRENNTRY